MPASFKMEVVICLVSGNSLIGQEGHCNDRGGTGMSIWVKLLFP